MAFPGDVGRRPELHSRIVPAAAWNTASAVKRFTVVPRRAPSGPSNLGIELRPAASWQYTPHEFARVVRSP